MPVAKKICHPDHPYILGAALDYHAPVVKALIKNLKFKGNKRTAEILADLLYGYIRGLPFDAGGFYILPVPLSEKRQRERGFNQAGLIAELLAAKLGAPLLSEALFKER
ncbi:MAG: hypothetical protein Q7S36_00520, partial [Candidatus Liptonbacteria bacterium]|nr:hypothetical protein [Candidatus Liptonbacteria bacterium]